MSMKWLAKMWESNLKGAELLMAIAIADHADDKGECFPGLDTLAAKVKLKKRQVQDLIDRLERKGIVKMTRGQGRGHKTFFAFQKVQNSAPIKPKEKVQESAIKGAGFCKEKVQVSASHIKEESLREPLREPMMNQDDATEAVKIVQSVFPLFDPSIFQQDTLNARISDFDVWRATVEFWGLNDYRTRSIGKMLEKYEELLAEKKNGSSKKHNGKYPAKRTDAEVFAESADFYDNYDKHPS